MRNRDYRTALVVSIVVIGVCAIAFLMEGSRFQEAVVALTAVLGALAI